MSAAKRAAVEEAVRELGYVPNNTARALASRRTGTVVLAVSSDEPGLFADPFFAEVTVGVSSFLEQTDLELVLLLANTARGKERLRRLLSSHRADGVMLMALRGDDPWDGSPSRPNSRSSSAGCRWRARPAGTWTRTTGAVAGWRPSTSWAGVAAGSR
ncbi:hypothetical protein ACFQZC_35985 [Streptacidiphilus monticola]